jgi:hypothetical protein
MSKSPWRKRAALIIYEVLQKMPPDSTEKQKRAALKKAYPFREREMHPYKIWCSQVNIMLKTPKKPKNKDPHQQSLF